MWHGKPNQNWTRPPWTPPPLDPDFIGGQKEILIWAIFRVQTFGFQAPPPSSLLIHPWPRGLLECLETNVTATDREVERCLPQPTGSQTGLA